MSSALRIVANAPRPAKRQKTDKAAGTNVIAEGSTAPGCRTDGDRFYAATTLNDNSFAINGDVHGDVHINSTQTQQVDRDKDEEKRKYETLMKSLAFPGMDARLRNIEPELENTCLWIVEHEQFIAWVDEKKASDHHGFLWIKGKPGCGKSTIMRVAYHWAKKEWSRHVNLCYFFNGRAPTQLEKSSLGLYRSLTYQVLQRFTDSRSVFMDKFASKEVDGDIEEWTATELKHFLQDVLTQPRRRKLNIFVDALDEGGEDDIRKLVSHLEMLGRRASSGKAHLRICLSSRHYPHISIANSLSLVLDGQQDHDRDIELYIRTTLPADEGSEMLTLRQEIFDKSKSVFLWVVLVIPMLRKVYDGGGSLKIEATRELLARLPGELDDLFAEIMAKDTTNMSVFVSLSQWVLFAARALTPTELYLGILYSQLENDAPVEVPSKERISRCLLNWSRGFVEETQSEPPTVQFIHETVRTFLLNANGLSPMKPVIEANIAGMAHESLRDGCLKFLKFAQVPISKPMRRTKQGREDVISDLIDKQPLIDYATHELLQHANQAQTHGLGQLLWLLKLTALPEDGWHNWIRFHNYFERFSTGELTLRVSVLYAASKLNLPDLVQCLAVSREDVNIRGERYNCALGVACWHEHENIVELLLQRGAHLSLLPKYLDDNRREEGHIRNFRIVKLLYESAGELSQGILGAALTSAIDKGATESFQVLLRFVVDVNMYDRSLLSLACRRKRAEIVQLLLEKNANVNDSLPRVPAIIVAVDSFETKIVRMLLRAGADVNATMFPDETPLARAAGDGNLEIVQLLLEAGADMRSSMWKHLKSDVVPLFRAAMYGYSDIVKLLLDAENDLETKEDFLQKALHWAMVGNQASKPYKGPHLDVMVILEQRLELIQAGHVSTSTSPTKDSEWFFSNPDQLTEFDDSMNWLQDFDLSELPSDLQFSIDPEIV